MRLRGIKRFCLLLAGITSVAICHAQYKLDTLAYAGNSSKYTDFIFLGDGFTESQMSQFKSAIKKNINYLFGKEPWKHYKSFFNIFYIQTPSNVSGAGLTPDAPVDNFYGTTFGYDGVDRMPWPGKMDKVYEVLYNTKPDFDVVIIIVNSTKYGGAGGNQFICYSLDNSSVETLCHELGHAFANLSDEYWYRGTESANMTQKINPVKWDYWVGTENTGVYPYEDHTTWYRPHQNCLMRYLNRDYCPVCREAIIEKIHESSYNIQEFSPKNMTKKNVGKKDVTFSVTLLKPVPNTLRVDWYLDDKRLDFHNEAEIVLTSAMVQSGDHELTVTVEDTTLMVRKAGHSSLHSESVTWKVFNNTSGIGYTQAQENRFTIGPLPFSTQLTFSMEKSDDTPVSLELYDMAGGLVQKEVFRGNSCTLNTERVKPGIYLLRVIQGDKLVYAQKVTKAG